MDISKNIKKALKENKISAAEVSRRTGINQSSFTRYTKGENIPSAEAVLKIAEAIGVSTDKLLRGTESDKYSVDELELIKSYRKLEGKYKKLAMHDVKHHFEVQEINKLT